MSNFNLEVRGFCANGAEVLAVFKDETDGVVLATWKQEFITWVFPTSDQSATAHGHYFMFNIDKDGDEQEAYQRARGDFVARVNKLFNVEA